MDEINLRKKVQQARIALQLGCKLAQGYGIVPPMPRHFVTDCARHWYPNPTWTGTQ